tara:strand:+ start:343 stop:504 length:162 start_codon:yes stop_codon:yes gene_type:complete
MDGARTGIIINRIDMFNGHPTDEVLVVVDYLGKGALDEYWFDCRHVEVISANR